MEIKVFKFDGIEGEIESLNDWLGEYTIAEYEAVVKKFLDIEILCLCVGEINFYTINPGDTIIIKEDAKKNQIVMKLDPYDLQKIR